MPSEQEWFYDVGGFEMGPVSFIDLLALARSQQIAADDRVKAGVNGKWRTVGSIGRLMAVLPFQEAKVEVATTPKVSRVDTAGHPRQAPAAHRTKESVSTAEIHTVKTSLTVNTVSAHPMKRTTPAQQPSPQVPDTNESILHAIRSKLSSRNLASLNQLEFHVDAGVVTISGTTSSEGERLLVKHLIQKTSGVVRVVDSSTTATSHPEARNLSTTRPALTSRAHGGGVASGLIANLPAFKIVHAASVAATVGLAGLGYWYFSTNPARPVAVHPVRGKIIMNGEPLANASIVLHRVGKSKLPINLHPRAKVSEDGTFSLETFDRADGAPNGEFIATVFLTKDEDVNGEKLPGPNILPVVYSRPETSPLKIQITSSTTELKPLELTQN